MLKLLFKNTKMIHVGWINAVRIILAVLPAVIGLLLCLVLPTELTRGLALAGGLLLMLVSVFRGMTLSLELGVMGTLLKGLRHDRKFFIPTTCPASRAEWESTVKERAAAVRFAPASEETPTGKGAPIFFGVKNTASLGSDCLECFALLYSVESLDAEGYRAVLSDAKKRIRKLPSRDAKKHKTRHFRISYGTAAAVVILAETVDGEAQKRVKNPLGVRDGSLYPAIVDCTEGRVYMDGTKHSRTDTDADAQRIIGRLVFGTLGKIPREGGEETDEYRELYDRLSKETFGDFLKERADTSDSVSRTEKRLFEELREGEFRLDDGVLYCKAEGKLMSLCFFPEADDDSEEPISETPETKGRVLTYDATYLTWDLPKVQDMTEHDKAVYLPRMVRYIESLGYRAVAESEDADA